MPPTDIGVLFCHGFTGSPDSLQEWADVTRDAGYRVSLPLLPGHGTTWQELATTSWQDWYSRVDEEYLALRASCRKVFVAGLSMGGALALRLAEQHTDAAGLLLVNPAVAHADVRQWLVPVLRHVIPSTASIGNDIKRPGVDEHSYDRTPLEAVFQMHRLQADVRSMLDLVTCPLVLFRSVEDHVVPAISSDLILRQVSSRETTEHLLENSYHVATMDYDRQFIFDTSLEFLQRHSAAKGKRFA